MFRRHSNALLDVISYGSAIRACEKGGPRQHAPRLLVEMRRIDLLPDVISYYFATSAIVKLDHGSRHSDVIRYNGAVKASVRSGRWMH